MSKYFSWLPIYGNQSLSAISPNGLFVASIGAHLLIWSIKTKKMIRQFPCYFFWEKLKIDFMCDDYLKFINEETLLIQLHDRFILFDWRKEEIVCSKKGAHFYDNLQSYILLSSNKISFFDYVTDRKEWSLSMKGWYEYKISNNGRFIALSNFRKWAVWDMKTRTRIFFLNSEKLHVEIIFHHDSRFFHLIEGSQEISLTTFYTKNLKRFRSKILLSKLDNGNAISFSDYLIKGDYFYCKSNDCNELFKINLMTREKDVVFDLSRRSLMMTSRFFVFGNALYLISDRGELVKLSTKTGKKLWRLDFNSYEYIEVVDSVSKHNCLFLNTGNYPISILHENTGELKVNFCRPSESLITAKVDRVSKRIYSTFESGYLHVWDIVNKRLTKSKCFTGHKILKLVHNTKEKIIICGTSKGVLLILDSFSLKIIKKMQTELKLVYDLEIVSSKKVIIIGGVSSLMVFDLSTFLLKEVIRYENCSHVTFKYSSKEQSLIVCSDKIYIYKVEKEKSLKKMFDVQAPAYGTVLGLHDDSSLLVVGELGFGFSIFDFKTKRLSKSFPLFGDAPKNVVFSVKFNYIFISTSYMSEIGVYDFKTKKELFLLKANEGSVSWLEYDDDRNLLISVADNGAIQYWSVPDFKLNATSVIFPTTIQNKKSYGWATIFSKEKAFGSKGFESLMHFSWEC